MNYDLIVVGGSYAGMAAALQLLRARRTVLIIDAGQRRNRAAAHSHGFLSQDGVDPEVIATTARAQLHAYPTLAWLDNQVVDASGKKDDFSVRTGSGGEYQARRLLMAMGVVDSLPHVTGLSDRWGRSVFHCPYCHGYELDLGRIGVIASGPMSLHQAHLLTEWGQVTFFLNGLIELDEQEVSELAIRGVHVQPKPVSHIEGHADLVLVDGDRQVFDGLFVAPRNSPSSPIAERLGCKLMDTPLGSQIWTSETKETSIPGVFACGDLARVPHSVSLAVGDGAWAGAQLHRSLVWTRE